jgi:hypothetical protein
VLRRPVKLTKGDLVAHRLWQQYREAGGAGSWG